MIGRALPAVVLCFGALAAYGQESLAGLEERAFKAAAAKVAASVVQIQTIGGLDRVGEVLTGSGPTSGTVVSEDGFVVSSAFHFAAKPAATVVTLPDGSRHDAEVVATDYSRMLTLLKIEIRGLVVPEPASPDAARVGEWALAVGKAFDPATANMSPGVISAKDRIWGKAIQTDAKTSPFNYGGPLIDIHGRVLGVIVPLSMTSDEVMAGAEWYDSGIGFAVPIDQVRESVERLRSGTDLYRGVLGVVTAKPGSMFAEPVVATVREGSAAAKAGLKAGDLIVEIDGRAVSRQAEALRAVGPKYAGETVEVVVRRGDRTESLAVTLERPTETSVMPERQPAEQPGEDGQAPGPTE